MKAVKLKPISILYSGLFLLLGRFDWSETQWSYSFRSYVASAYLVCILIPVLFFSFNLIFKKTKTAFYSTLLVETIYVFPFHWLGLDRYYYHLNHKIMEDWRTKALPLPESIWFPNAFNSLPDFPNEVMFFLAIAVFGTVGIYFIRKSFTRFDFLGLVILFNLIVFQSFNHTSLRSPYTYIPHYEQSKEAKYWYHYYLFPNAKAAVNLDYHAFRKTEELFHGQSIEIDALLTRPLPGFLAAPFTAFLNSFTVFLCMNILFWFIATAALYAFAKNIIGKQSAYIATVLMASAQGMNLYVAQPKVYAVAIAGCSLILLAFKTFFTKLETPFLRIVSFAFALALFFLCYESQPWIFAFLILGWYFKFDLKEVVVSLIVGFILYKGFIILCQNLPHTHVGETLAVIDESPTVKLKKLLLSGNVLAILLSFLRSMRGYLRCGLHAFMPCVPFAVAGFYLIRKQKERILIFAILLPGILTYTFFEMGSSFYTQFPRLVYPGYPAIYMAAGITLATLWEWKGRLGQVLSIVSIGSIFIYLNIDTWGYPVIYYTWFYRNFGFSLNP